MVHWSTQYYESRAKGCFTVAVLGMVHAMVHAMLCPPSQAGIKKWSSTS